MNKQLKKAVEDVHKATKEYLQTSVDLVARTHPRKLKSFHKKASQVLKHADKLKKAVRK